MTPYIITAVLIFISAISIIAILTFSFNQKRELKDYERSLKMVHLLIHLPPRVEDIAIGSRDERDVVDEALSEAQTMYSILNSTAVTNLNMQIYGQRHISLEIVASGGTINYYVVAPTVLTNSVRQAISTAYPTARIEEAKGKNIFNQEGKMSGVTGGEFSLRKDFIYPIASYQETKKDAARAILNAFSSVQRDEGLALQIMIRPASQDWTKKSFEKASNIRKGKKERLSGGFPAITDFFSALWKPPEDASKQEKQLTNTETAEMEAIENKAKFPSFETLIRVVASSASPHRSQTILNSLVSSFSLFDSPSNNGFRFLSSNDNDKLTADYVLRRFPKGKHSDILNSVELSSIFHLPSQSSIPTSQVQRQMTKQVDGPVEEVSDGLLLGINEFRGNKKEIRLSDKDRRRHTYIIGQTGTGKSWLINNLAFQDMMDGRGFAVIDPHGDLAEDLLGMVPPERIDDVIYFNPSDRDNPIGLNMFEIDNPDQMDFIISETISMLYSLYDPGHTGIVGPRMENIVRNAMILLMSDPNGGTFMDIPKVLVDPEFAKSKLKYLSNQRAIDFWTKEWPAAQRSNDAGEVTSWVVSKWAPFENGLLNNILGQTKSGFNIRQIMDEGKILIVNLSKGLMGEQPSKLIGMVLVMKFQAAAMSRANLPESERRDFCLFVDEFQNFATDSFVSILSEARKYRLNLMLANQFMTQLKEEIKEAILGNIGTVISGRIGITDAEILQKKFQPSFTAEDLAKMPNFQSIASVMINNVPSAPFSMNWLPQMGQPNPEVLESLKTLSSIKYGKPRAQVEEDIKKRLNSSMSSTSSATSSTHASEDLKKDTAPNSFLDSWLEKKKQIPKAPTPELVQNNTQTKLATSSPGPAKLDIKNPPQDSETMLKIR